MNKYVKIGLVFVGIISLSMSLYNIVVIGAVVPAVIAGVLAVIGIIWLAIGTVRCNNESCNSYNVAADKLLKADKGDNFETEIAKLIGCLCSLNIKCEFFESQDKEGSVYKAYKLIESRILQNVESATVFVRHYDIVLQPKRKYLKMLVNESIGLAEKLSELSDSVLELNDSVTDIDTSFADDMLVAIRKVVENSYEEE